MEPSTSTEVPEKPRPKAKVFDIAEMMNMAKTTAAELREEQAAEKQQKSEAAEKAKSFLLKQKLEIENEKNDPTKDLTTEAGRQISKMKLQQENFEKEEEIRRKEELEVLARAEISEEPGKKSKKSKKNKKSKKSKKEKKSKKSKKEKQSSKDSEEEEKSSGDEMSGGLIAPALPPGFMLPEEKVRDEPVGPSFPNPEASESVSSTDKKPKKKRKSVGFAEDLEKVQEIPGNSAFGGTKPYYLEDESDSDDDNIIMTGPQKGKKADLENREIGKDGDLPLSKCFTFYHGDTNRKVQNYEIDYKKSVTAMALNHSGAKIATAGADYNVNFYEFAGMDTRGRSYKEILSPVEHHQIRDLAWSRDSKYVLIGSGRHQVLCLNMEGNKVFGTKAGDRYIRDANQTKGHQAMVNSVCWNPLVESEFISGSNDGTVRTWDMEKGVLFEDTLEKNQQVRKLKNTRAGFNKISATVCVYTPVYVYPTATNIPAESLGIIAGGDDGSLHFWDQRQSSNFCKCTIHEAHDMGKVSSLAISHCGKYIASRGEDAAVKVWDIRMLSGKTKGDAKAISVYKGYPLTTDREDICFNPTDNKLCLTTSISKLDKQTKQRSYENELVVLRRDQVDNTPYYVKNMTEISEGSKIIRTFWHDRLNQILMACENGKIHTMYDEIISTNGALLCASKVKKVTHITHRGDQPIGEILAPIGLPIKKDSDAYNITDVGIKIRYYNYMRQEGMIKAKYGPKEKYGQWAEEQAHGLGWDGVAANLARSLAQPTADVTPENVREKILRHNDTAIKNPKYGFHAAYKDTQPKIFYQDDEATAKRKLEESRKIPGMFKKPKMSSLNTFNPAPAGT